MPHLTTQHLRGQLQYRRGGQESGREWWTWTRNADGTETLRSICEIDPPAIQREVTYNVDAAGRPREVYVRLVREGAWVGSGVYRFGAGRLEADLWGPDRPVERAHAELPERFVFITHPVSLDGWQLRSYDRRAGGVQELVAFNVSTRPDGGDGPLLRTHPDTIEMVEEDAEIEVGGGRFRCAHFQIIPSDPGLEPLQVWVEPERNIMVYMDWTGYGDFELVRLDAPGENGSAHRPG